MTTRAVAIIKGLTVLDDSEIPDGLGVESVERFGASLIIMHNSDLSDAGCISGLTIAAENLTAKFKPATTPIMTIVCDESETLIIPIYAR